MITNCEVIEITTNIENEWRETFKCITTISSPGPGRLLLLALPPPGAAAARAAGGGAAGPAGLPAGLGSQPLLLRPGPGAHP